MSTSAVAGGILDRPPARTMTTSRSLKRTFRGSACTSQLLDLRLLDQRVNNPDSLCQVFVYFCCVPQLRPMRKPPCRFRMGAVFVGPRSAVTLRGSSVRFAVPQCFAAPQNFERIVGRRLGLLGLYWGAVLIATKVFHRGNLNSLAMIGRCPRWFGTSSGCWMTKAIAR